MRVNRDSTQTCGTNVLVGLIPSTSFNSQSANVDSFMSGCIWQVQCVDQPRCRTTSQRHSDTPTRHSVFLSAFHTATQMFKSTLLRWDLSLAEKPEHENPSGKIEGALGSSSKLHNQPYICSSCLNTYKCTWAAHTLHMSAIIVLQSV